MKHKYHLLITSLLLLIIVSCTGPQKKQSEITISIQADYTVETLRVVSGSTVQQIIDQKRISLGHLDRLSPPLYTVLSDGDLIRIIRVREVFETKQNPIQFDYQELYSESLPEGESRLIQAGETGLIEITTRIVYEDNVEIGNSVVKETIIKPVVSEIIMIGVKAGFSPITIPGKIAYMTAGNAWLMETNTSMRRPLITTGDLDGRIFRLSPNGSWLLFSRKSLKSIDKEINTLWVVNTTIENPTPINLKISNVIHFADFIPGKINGIAYSTVEPRAVAPGWQANNDLFAITFFSYGGTTLPKQIVEANSGGSYGWWGTNFTYSPDGKELAYARPDGVGIVIQNKGILENLVSMTPLNTHSDWAWIPGITWGADGQNLYTITHKDSQGIFNEDDSPNFNLISLSILNNFVIDIANNVGMFSYPTSSPFRNQDYESSYSVAFLDAVFPLQSDNSRYRLAVMDRDGSNTRILFPEDSKPGIDAQEPVWAPDILSRGEDIVAILYQGDLWFIDINSGISQQITGDGLISQLDWK